MAWIDRQNVLDSAMLECLAVIAAANNRSVVEELNIALKTYVLKEFAEQGEELLVERAFSDQPASATK